MTSTTAMKIEKIEPSKHKQGRVLVFLEEGTLLRITEQELLRFDLRPGMDLSAADVVQLKKSGGASEARTKGAEMIGRQMLSKKELTGRLVKKGAEEKDARDAADWLEDLGAVNDAAYAAALARRCAAGGYGRLRLREELRRRGVPEALWDQAFALLPPVEEAVAVFVAKKYRGGSDPKAMKRLSESLMRRGFTWQEIRPVLRRLTDEIDET